MRSSRVVPLINMRRPDVQRTCARFDREVVLAFTRAQAVRSLHAGRTLSATAIISALRGYAHCLSVTQHAPRPLITRALREEAVTAYLAMAKRKRLQKPSNRVLMKNIAS